MPVPEAGSAFRVHRHRALPGAQRADRLVQRRRRLDQRGQPVPGLQQRDRRCGRLAWLARLLHRRLLHRRLHRLLQATCTGSCTGSPAPARSPPPPGGRGRLRSAVTPGASGGSPAAAHNASHHAARCPSSVPGSSRRPGSPGPPAPAAGPAGASGPVGDQARAARTRWRRARSAFAPKPSVTTRVTVPLGCPYAGRPAVQRLGQPVPADLADQRVRGDLRVEVGPDVHDDAEQGHPSRPGLPGRTAGPAGRWRCRSRRPARWRPARWRPGPACAAPGHPRSSVPGAVRRTWSRCSWSSATRAPNPAAASPGCTASARVMI